MSTARPSSRWYPVFSTIPSKRTTSSTCPLQRTMWRMGSSMSRYKRAPIYYCTHVFPASRAALVISNYVITTSPHKAVISAFTTPKIQAYILKKTRWTTAIFHSVDWDSHERYLNSLLYPPPSQENKGYQALYAQLAEHRTPKEIVQWRERRARHRY